MTVQDIDVAYMFDDMGNLDDDLSSLLVPDLDGTYGAGSSTSLAKSAADAMPTGMSFLYQLLSAAPMIGYCCTGHCTRATVTDDPEACSISQGFARRNQDRLWCS